MTAGRALTAESMLQDAENCLDRRELATALEGFNRAEASGADPDRCAAGRWMAFMLRGDFASAWRESDAIRRRGAPDPHRFWNDEDIRGKRLIVRCLHGLGDAVQFLRYAPALRQVAGNVIFEVPPRFVELAQCFDAVDKVITWGDPAARAIPAWDVQMEVMELPYFFRTELDDLPIRENYLHLPDRTLNAVAHEIRDSTRPRVGVVWNAGEWNPSRCVPFSALTPLLESADCDFWSLQGPDAISEETSLPRHFLRQVAGCRNSIITLAAVIAQLDLVLTVDTLAAHLAGALGIPAWVMLQYAADWRWMTNTARSPWYPSLRLFRQRQQGDWTGVVADVQHSLRAWSREFSGRPVAS
jgi:hypothetical protein